jgi:hypothetical protein
MVYLEDDDLGRLDLDCEDGFVVSSFEIGFPLTREVVRGRSLSDGVFDDTRYLGSRVITVVVRMISGGCDAPGTSQSLIDEVMPFLSPRRRPRLAWSLQRDPNEMRSAVVRGLNAPVLINQRAYPSVVFQWVTVDSYLELPDETCFIANPNIPAVEQGRDYDLTFDRTYAPGGPTDSIFVINPGTAPANWTGTILASANQPNIVVNGTSMSFNANGGVNLIAGQTLVIDTRERTILLNNDPNESRYDRVNFEQWSWDDVLLRPGLNVIRFNGTGAWFDVNTRLEICTRGAWL